VSFWGESILFHTFRKYGLSYITQSIFEMELPTENLKKSLESCRKDFPSLAREYDQRALVYLDGPGGSQVPQAVIDAVSNYYHRSNANSHGAFVTSKETDTVIHQARKRMAAFLGAEGPETISFGQNMTTLNFSLSKALARFMDRDSEILITQLDHEANRGPWLALQEVGFTINEIRLQPDGTLDYADLQRKLNNNTALLAIGYASNALGTVNDLAKVRNWTRQTSTLLLVDAVHYAPHFKVDVSALDCDFLLCSAYKFYGPHVGILYSKPGLLDQLSTDRLVTQEDHAPYRIETGTLNHAALAGVIAAVDYLGSFGDGDTIRTKLEQAMTKISGYEHGLFHQLYTGLSEIAGVQVIGPEPDPDWHTPTISFTVEGFTPAEVCRFLASRSICAWDGHFYAQRAIEVLGLLPQGGVTRMGINMYTSREEVAYTIACIGALLAKDK
jgi:cysteine desulfurase family protein (TIGR01976 family)